MSRLHPLWALEVLCLTLIALLTVPAVGSSPIRVACIGDSITYGPGIPNRLTTAWPGQLQKMLGKHYLVENFGHGGATALRHSDLPYWTTPEFRQSTAFKGNIVIIMLGSNDSKPWNWKHRAHFSADLTAMVKHYQSLTVDVKVWLCLPPPAFKASFGVTQKTIISAVIPDIKAVATKLHVPTINLQRAMRNDRPLFQKDGVHPTMAGQHKIAAVIYHSIARK